MSNYFSHGKLLISGEYVLLDQALALAVPTQFGQQLRVKKIDEERKLTWESFTENGECWYAQTFQLKENGCEKKNTRFHESAEKDEIDGYLILILNKAMQLNPSFLSQGGFSVKTQLDFDRKWGLGSSSTLICNIAKWAEVDAFKLSEASFGGSGYDIAVGMMGGDILYRSPKMWEGFVFNPPFKENLFFVHLNQKQNSREGIKTYRSKPKSKKVIEAISQLTEQMAQCEDFDLFQALINKHEKWISELIEKQPIKEVMFSDYPFSIKSLGAWGGDFIMACGDGNTRDYFRTKGFHTILSYTQLIK